METRVSKLLSKETRDKIGKQCDFEARFRMTTEKFFFMKKLLRQYLNEEELTAMAKDFEGCDQMCVMIEEPPLKLNIIDVSVAAGQVLEETYGKEVNPLED